MKALATKNLDSDTLTYAQSKGLAIECVPFIKVKPVEVDLDTVKDKHFDAIVFTSAHAVDSFFEHPDANSIIENKKVFSLAGKTADALVNYNTKPYLTATDAAFLALVIIESNFTQSALHVCGNLALDILKEKLMEAGIQYLPVIAYETILQNEVTINGQFDTVLFFSPSGVNSFFAKNKLASTTLACCIGSTTAAALKQKSPDTIIITPVQPAPQAMIDAIELYYKPHN